MDLEKTKTALSDVWHIVFLVILVMFFLGVLTWSNVLPPDTIPGWRSFYDPVYLMFTGKQEMLIVFGDDGLGDPTRLQSLIRNPTVLGKTVPTKNIALINAGNLTEYDVVIVTRAKTLSTKELQYFIDYANAGGKLVWTGDAGTKLTGDDRMLSEADLDENGRAERTYGPWARRDEDTAVRFDELLGLDYLGNFCEVVSCDQAQATSQGHLVSSSPNHPLIIGLREDASLYGDFALVEEKGGIGNRRVLSLDHGSAVIQESEEANSSLPGVPSTQAQDLGKVFPIIMASGLGEKILYYAQPLEDFKSKGKNEITDVEEFRQSSIFVQRLYRTLRR